LYGDGADADALFLHGEEIPDEVRRIGPVILREEAAATGVIIGPLSMLRTPNNPSVRRVPLLSPVGSR